MNSFNVILAQAKATKSTWSTTRGGGACHVRFQGNKKRLAEGEEMNVLVANAVKSVFTTNKLKKDKASSDPVSEDEQDKFNFETLKIG